MKIQASKGSYIVLKTLVPLKISPLHPLKNVSVPPNPEFKPVTEYTLNPRQGTGMNVIKLTKKTKGLTDKISFKLDHHVRRGLYGGYYYQSQMGLPHQLYNRTFSLDISNLTSDDISVFQTPNGEELCVEIPEALRPITKETRVDLSTQRLANIGYEE